MSNNQSATPADQDERAQFSEWRAQWNEWNDDLNALVDWIEDFKAANPGVVNSRAILDMAQHAYVAGRKEQREIDAARRPVGQASPELFAAARDFYNETVADPTVRISCASPEQRDVVTTAGERLRTALAAPPAKAVDLDAVRALLQRRIEQWRSHLPADPGAPGTREIETKGEHDYNNDVRIYREGIAVMEEAVALIDSHAGVE